MEEKHILGQKLMAMLRLTRQPVGVKLTYSKDEYDCFDAYDIKAPLEYCVAVRSAGSGRQLKLSKTNSRCPGSTAALGFTPPKDAFYTGESGCNLGLFKDLSVAAKTNSQMKILKKPLYGVVVKPADTFVEGPPDVVIVVGEAREIMRLVQGYTCSFGMQPNLNITGNQAVCVECTGYPILTGEMNLSLLCSGTRFLAKWADNEIGVGIPYEKWAATVQGVQDTINGTELDSRKAEIEKALAVIGFKNGGITMGSAYYLSTRKSNF